MVDQKVLEIINSTDDKATIIRKELQELREQHKTAEGAEKTRIEKQIEEKKSLLESTVNMRGAQVKVGLFALRQEMKQEQRENAPKPELKSSGKERKFLTKLKDNHVRSFRKKGLR